ncbi:MAG TPA: hypothetical protein ENN41_06200 [Sediminispirochaeta sp.]|nr:hypothetical protein [Sediminispirochaeta sp.]
MVLSFYRQGGSKEGELKGYDFKAHTTSTGSAQRQLLLDFEEDRLCVVRQVRAQGAIGGRRLWPSSYESDFDELDRYEDIS